MSMRIAVLTAGLSDPSSTGRLAAKLAAAAIDTAAQHDTVLRTDTIALAPLAEAIAHALITGERSAGLQSAIQTLTAADAVIIATPVYKGGVSGLMKMFIDILDPHLLRGRPALLAATGGSARHALVVDQQLRPLLAFMRAAITPTAVYAAPGDWDDPALTNRILDAAAELTDALEATTTTRTSHLALAS